MTTPEPVPPSGLAGAAERLRQAARWLVAAFGAVAAVVFTGVGVSSFGALDADTDATRFTAALIGAGAAILGTLAALVTAMSLAAASAVTTDDLTADTGGRSLRHARLVARNSPALAPWERDLFRFTTDVRVAYVEFDEAWRAWRAAEPTARPALKKKVDEARAWHAYVTSVEGVVLEAASYTRLRTRFADAGWILACALVAATAGGVLFVWATGKPAGEHIPTAVTQATWNVPADRRDAVGRLLGDGCARSLDALPVVIVGSQAGGAEFEIVTDPDSACPAVRLTVAKAELTRPVG